MPDTPLTAEEHAKNNLPDVLGTLGEPRRKRTRPLPNRAELLRAKADIVAQGYDLSLNRYKEVVHEEVEHRPPLEILADLAKLEAEIQQGMKELEAMLR